MARNYSYNFTIQPKNKIVKRSVAKEQNKGFWATLLSFIGITTVSILAGIFTGGIGTAVGESLGLSMFGTEALSVGFSGITQFAIDTTYDALTGNLNTKNILMNLAFSFAEVGRIGRALKADKIIKFANEMQYFEKLGIKGTVKNFAELRKILSYKDFIIHNKWLRFNKKVANEDIISAIATLANAETIKTIKAMSQQQLQSLVRLTQSIRKYAPGVIQEFSKEEIARARKWLNARGHSLDNFLKMTNEDSFLFFDAIRKNSNISISVIQKLDALRQTSNFYGRLTSIVAKTGRWASRITQYTDPVYWVRKVFKKMIEPIEEAIKNISEKVTKLYKKAITKIKEELEGDAIPPTNPATSMFSYFKLYPAGVTGEVLLRMVKKEHVKKNGEISKYRDIMVVTDMFHAEEFLTNPHQNTYYLHHWAIGWARLKRANSILAPFLGSSLIRSGIMMYATISNIVSGKLWKKITNPTGFNIKSELINTGSNLLSTLFVGSPVLGTFISAAINNNFSANSVLKKINGRVTRHIKHSSIRFRGD
jgi:hypothetical protein